MMINFWQWNKLRTSWLPSLKLVDVDWIQNTRNEPKNRVLVIVTGLAISRLLSWFYENMSPNNHSYNSNRDSRILMSCNTFAGKNHFKIWRDIPHMINKARRTETFGLIRRIIKNSNCEVLLHWTPQFVQLWWTNVDRFFNCDVFSQRNELRFITGIDTDNCNNQW